MAAYLSPVLNGPQCDSNGKPLVGGKILSYVAGSATLAATYSTSAGTFPQTNPIILNARGLPANPIWIGAGQSLKLVLTDANDVVLQTIDGVTGVNDPAATVTVDQWALYTAAPTYISATSFSVVGDQTGTFQVNRRLKTLNTGGTLYSTITASAYNSGTGLTTVTVFNDSSSLDSGLSQASYALLSADNQSIPKSLAPTTLTLGGKPVSAVLLGVVSASSSATVDFTGLAGAAYSAYVLVVDGLAPATNSTNFIARISTGSGFLTASYRHGTWRWTNAASGVNGSTSDTGWVLSGVSETCGNAISQLSGYVLTILGADSTYAAKRAVWSTSGLFASGSYVGMQGAGEVDANSAVIDGVRCLMSSGNIASGTFRLYGLRNS